MISSHWKADLRAARYYFGVALAYLFKVYCALFVCPWFSHNWAGDVCHDCGAVRCGT